MVELTSKMNPAIDLRTAAPKEMVIGGRTFRTARNTFMGVMEQRHFWYADEQEIIYINYNMLKDEQVRYPEVLQKIVDSMSW